MTGIGTGEATGLGDRNLLSARRLDPGILRLLQDLRPPSQTGAKSETMRRIDCERDGRRRTVRTLKMSRSKVIRSRSHESVEMAGMMVNSRGCD